MAQKAQKETFLTPVGRLVGGSFTELNKKDHKGRDLAPEKYNWWAGLAFPKTAANWWEEPGELGVMFQAILRAANSWYVNGETQSPDFAWKIHNGDDPKHAGKTGYAGHWVVGFSRNVQIDQVKVYDTNFKPVIDPNMLKKGFYYRIDGSTSANENTGDQAGMYINMQTVQLCALGDEIVSGPSAETIFGQAPAMQLPTGARPVNVAAPTPAAAPVAAPTPAAAPVKVMTEKAGGATYEQFVAQNWTDEMMIEQGYMVITTPAPGFLTGNGY